MVFSDLLDSPQRNQVGHFRLASAKVGFQALCNVLRHPKEIYKRCVSYRYHRTQEVKKLKQLSWKSQANYKVGPSIRLSTFIIKNDRIKTNSLVSTAAKTNTKLVPVNFNEMLLLLLYKSNTTIIIFASFQVLYKKYLAPFSPKTQHIVGGNECPSWSAVLPIFL